MVMDKEGQDNRNAKTVGLSPIWGCGQDGRDETNISLAPFHLPSARKNLAVHDLANHLKRNAYASCCPRWATHPTLYRTVADWDGSPDARGKIAVRSARSTVPHLARLKGRLPNRDVPGMFGTDCMARMVRRGHC